MGIPVLATSSWPFKYYFWKTGFVGLTRKWRLSMTFLSKYRFSGSNTGNLKNDTFRGPKLFEIVIFGPKITFNCSLKHFSSKFFLLNGFRRNVFCLFFDSSSISAAYQLFRKSENSEFSKIFQKFFKNFLLWSLLTVFFSLDLCDDLWLWDHSLLTE